MKWNEITKHERENDNEDKEKNKREIHTQAMMRSNEKNPPVASTAAS